MPGIEEFGPNSYLNVPGKTVAVKTGTTDDKRDNWAVGYTKSITVGVWVGNNDNSKMNPKIALRRNRSPLRFGTESCASCLPRNMKTELWISQIK